MSFAAFKDKPSSPPSRAQEVADEGAANTSESSLSEFGGSIKRLMSNKGYVLLLITYGLNVGVFYAISTLLNLIIVQHFTVNKLSLYIGRRGRHIFPNRQVPSIKIVHEPRELFLFYPSSCSWMKPSSQ